MPTTAPLPKISIITPSFNQGEFLEETILSVLQDGYPNLEYLILDGGSTDLSPFIIDRYRERLAFVRSSPDAGQYHAIQEGIQKSTGELVAWINSDDKYHPGALWRMAEAAQRFPDALWFCGLPTVWNGYGDLHFVNRKPPEWTLDYLLGLGSDPEPYFIQQESTFFRRSIWKTAGASFDLSLRLAGDYELWLRFTRIQQVKQLDTLIGGFRMHKMQRSAVLRDTYMNEVDQSVSAQRAADAAKPPAVPAPPQASAPYLHRVRDPIVLATSIAPHRQYAQYRAVQTWLDAGFRVLSFNESPEIDRLRANFPRVEFVAVERTARKLVGKPLVYIADVLSSFARGSDGICGIVNSDISFTNTVGIQDALAHQMREHDLVVSSRIEVGNPARQVVGSNEQLGRANVRFGSVYLWGFDIFLMTREATGRVVDAMGRDSPFAFGVPWWDYIVPSMALKLRLRTGVLNPPPISHPSHAANYQWRLWQLFGHWYLHALGVDAEPPNADAFESRHPDAYLSRLCLQFVQLFARASSRIDLRLLVDPPEAMPARLGFGDASGAALSSPLSEDAVMQVAVGNAFGEAPFLNLAGHLRDALELDLHRRQATELLNRLGIAHGQ